MLWGTNRGKWKRPAAARSRTQDTSGLSRQCSATEPWQPDNHQPSQSSMYTALTICHNMIIMHNVCSFFGVCICQKWWDIFVMHRYLKSHGTMFGPASCRNLWSIKETTGTMHVFLMLFWVKFWALQLYIYKLETVKTTCGRSSTNVLLIYVQNVG